MFNEYKRQNRGWYRLSEHQREAAVKAELNRRMTPAELAEWEAEIREEAGLDEEEEIDEDEINALFGKHRGGRKVPLTLVWSNPNPPRKSDDDDDHRRHSDLRIRTNRPGPSRTEGRLEVDDT
jgi:hypothetical protein